MYLWAKIFTGSGSEGVNSNRITTLKLLKKELMKQDWLLNTEFNFFFFLNYPLDELIQTELPALKELVKQH